MKNQPEESSEEEEEEDEGKGEDKYNGSDGAPKLKRKEFKFHKMKLMNANTKMKLKKDKEKDSMRGSNDMNGYGLIKQEPGPVTSDVEENTLHFVDDDTIERQNCADKVVEIDVHNPMYDDYDQKDKQEESIYEEIKDNVDTDVKVDSKAEHFKNKDRSKSIDEIIASNRRQSWIKKVGSK